MTTNEKTKKCAAPDALFSRFLQRRARKPTEVQLSNWENDGGHPDDTKEEDFVIINGRVCCSAPERFKASVLKYWRLLRMKFHSEFSQPQQQGS